MNYILLNEKCVPQKLTYRDAGFDLRSSISTIIYPGQQKVIPLGVRVSIPDSMFGLLTHRSSLAFKSGCIISTGIIDSSFTGELKALIINLSEEERPIVIEEGERIAQLILIELNPYIRLNKVEEIKDGKEGFGSTGKD